MANSGFSVDDDVLAHHGPMIYQAKVLKVEERAVSASGAGASSSGSAKETQYFLHYQGWNKKWDEWVGPDRVMALNDENKAKQAEHNSKKRKTDKERKQKKVEEKAKENALSKKRKIDATRELEDDAGEAVVKVPIPFGLKKQLVDDWEAVTREPRHLVPLPRSPSVAQVLAEFVEAKRKSVPNAVQNFQEVCDGIKLYFDRALGTILLYRSEREQYDAWRAEQPEADASAHYGAEHLLRLFVRLPYLLAQTDLDEGEMQQLQAKLGDVLKFLQKRQAVFFLKEYQRVEDDGAAAGSAGAGEGAGAAAGAGAGGAGASSSAAGASSAAAVTTTVM
eukprot:g529.t1